MLAETPRADMPGYEPAQTDALRDQRYAARASEEHRMREARAKNLRLHELPGQP